MVKFGSNPEIYLIFCWALENIYEMVGGGKSLSPSPPLLSPIGQQPSTIQSQMIENPFDLIMDG